MTKQKGIDFLVQVNTGTTEVPVYKTVGAQRGASLSRSAETLDATSKESEGWSESLAGLKSWSISTDGLLVLDDEAYGLLEEAFMNSENVLVQIASKSGLKYAGDAIITTFDIDAPYDDLATYSIELTGANKLEKL